MNRMYISIQICNFIDSKYLRQKTLKKRKKAQNGQRSNIQNICCYSHLFMEESTVKPVPVVTSIKQLPLLSRHR
jgi:hypothetical protein